MVPKKFDNVEPNNAGFREIDNRLVLLNEFLNVEDFAQPIFTDVTNIVVGAPGREINNKKIGCVYVFRGGTTIEEDWQYKATINSPVEASHIPDDEDGLMFGHSVSITSDGAMIAIGAPGESPVDRYRVGAVYIFKRQDQDSSSWSLSKRIFFENLEDRKEFGYSVSLSDDGRILHVCTKKFENICEIITYIGVGANSEDWAFSGARTTRFDSATHFTYKTKRLKTDPSDADSPDRIAVLDGTRASSPFIFFGKPYADANKLTESVDVDFYTKNKIDNILKLKKTIQNPNGQPEDYFGHSISSSTPYLYKTVIGSPGYDDKKGKIYIYTYDGRTFNLFNELESPSPQEGELFGISVSTSSELETGATFLYALYSSLFPAARIEKVSGWTSSYISFSDLPSDERQEISPPSLGKIDGIKLKDLLGTRTVAARFLTNRELAFLNWQDKPNVIALSLEGVLLIPVFYSEDDRPNISENIPAHFQFDYKDEDRGYIEIGYI
jgi:hypothetical protein